VLPVSPKNGHRGFDTGIFRKGPSSPSGGPPLLKELSDRSSSDSTLEIEAEDDFPVLPVRLRSPRELEADKAEDADGGDDPLYSPTKEEMRERDLRHASELEKHALELEKLHATIAELREQHSVEIRALERTFDDERRQREDLLEQALGYAEELEAAERQASKDHETRVGGLLGELRDKDTTIRRLEAENARKEGRIRELRTAQNAKTGDQIKSLQDALAAYESRIEALGSRTTTTTTKRVVE